MRLTCAYTGTLWASKNKKMKIILISILSFLIFENNSSFEIEIVYDADSNQSYLWHVDKITDKNGKEITHSNSTENQKIQINKSGIYTISFKSKFGERTNKEIEISSGKRMAKIKIPTNFYKEVKPKELLKEIGNAEKFSIFKLQLSCWGEYEEMWNFDKQNYKVEIHEDDQVNSIEFIVDEYEQIVKQITKLKKNKKSSVSRDFFAIKINNKVAFIDGGKYVWTGYYQINEKLEKE